MIKLNDKIQATIEKIVYEGMGLIRYGKDNFVIFVKNVLPKEEVIVKITSINKHFAKAELEEIITPNEHRIKPFCPLYNACGSCNMQICDYDYQIEQKSLILKDIFKDIIDENKIFPALKSPQEKEYRHKIQYPARQTKNSKRILLGYFKENSHNLTNIKFCPIQPQIINEIAQEIRESFPFDCYFEKNHKGLLKNILMRINSNLNELLITFVLNCQEKEFHSKYKQELINFGEKLAQKFPIIKGEFVNLNTLKTNKILSNQTIKIFGKNDILEILEDKNKKITYKIGATSFFQVNPKSAINLFNLVEENIEDSSTILDAYGGVGAIGIWVNKKAKHITLVEENANATNKAKENFELNNIKNYTILKGDAKKHFLNFKKENKTFDYIILDPPRSGCDKEGLEAIMDLAKNIIYVSCNPQTLKRDMKILIENNFKPSFIKGVDLFPHTHHIESVALFKKQ